MKVAPASGTEWAVVASTTSTLELRSVTDSVSVVDITYASSVKQLTTEVVKATVRLENAVDSWSNIAGLSPPEGTILLGHNSAVPPTAWRIYAYLNSGWRYVALT